MLTDLRTRILPPAHVTSPSSTSLSSHAGDLYFFKPTSDYFEFTPYSLHMIYLDDKQWKTVSHYFQAQKFLSRPDIVTLIQNCTTAQGTWDIAHAHDYVKVMYICVDSRNRFFLYFFSDQFIPIVIQWIYIKNIFQTTKS